MARVQNGIATAAMLRSSSIYSSLVVAIHAAAGRMRSCDLFGKIAMGGTHWDFPREGCR
jgi:hypothetical protein